jgi:hypothetical protein
VLRFEPLDCASRRPLPWPEHVRLKSAL